MGGDTGQGEILKTFEDKSRYTGEELETLWRLTTDSDGKMGKGKSKKWGNNVVWNEKLTEELFTLVNNVESEPPGVSSEQWRKFFTTLGAKAKEDFLTNYRNATPASFGMHPSMFIGSHYAT